MSASKEFIKKLTEELAKKEADKQAVIEEFSKSIPLEWSPEDLKEKIRELLGKAYARISLTIDSEEESLAYKAAWDVMKVGMGQIAITDSNDPNKEFMDFLKGVAKEPDDEPSDKKRTS